MFIKVTVTVAKLHHCRLQEMVRPKLMTLWREWKRDFNKAVQTHTQISHRGHLHTIDPLALQPRTATAAMDLQVEAVGILFTRNAVTRDYERRNRLSS